MEPKTYLMFELNDLRYGIETNQVREIFRLPELTPIADAPGDIIGILNFRGTILPVMHLAKRLGQTMPTCHLSDNVIVIKQQGLQVGMVVSQVYNVQSLDPSTIEPEPTYGLRNPKHTAFVAGVGKIDDELITLLNPQTLIRQTDEVALMVWEAKLNGLDSDGPDSDSHKSTITSAFDDKIESFSNQIDGLQQATIPCNFFDLYCPDSTTEEQKIFHQRAVELRQSLENSNASELIPLAVVKLAEEYFGIELERVREFINIPDVTQIPCCPSYIVGNINLRGEVMTLVDIRKALNLSRSKDELTKAIIVEVDDVIAGVTVDQALDVIYLLSSDIAAMPTAVSKRYQAFFQGTTRYHQTTLSILDLSKVLFQEDLMMAQVT